MASPGPPGPGGRRRATRHRSRGVVLDFRNNAWKFQPPARSPATAPARRHVRATPAGNRARGGRRRPQAGDLQRAELLQHHRWAFDACDPARCTYFNDRDGQPGHRQHVQPATARAAPRTTENLAASAGQDRPRDQRARRRHRLASRRSRTRSALGETDRDDALPRWWPRSTRTPASTRWAFAPSPPAADLPPSPSRTSSAPRSSTSPPPSSLVGRSKVLVGAPRSPTPASRWPRRSRPTGARRGGVRGRSPTTSSPRARRRRTGDNADPTARAPPTATGSRRRTALVDFADDSRPTRGTDGSSSTGDFNSYTEEDPMQVLYDAGFTSIESDTPARLLQLQRPVRLARPRARQRGGRGDGRPAPTSGTSTPTSRSPSSTAGSTTTRRTSTTDRPVRGLRPQPRGRRASTCRRRRRRRRVQILGPTTSTAGSPTTRQVPRPARGAGRGGRSSCAAENPDTVFAAAGDLIGASTFESFIQNDKPTIDALNEAGLDVSAVGNHEFDQGYDDLVDRVMARTTPTTTRRRAEWDYLGANVAARTTDDAGARRRTLDQGLRRRRGRLRRRRHRGPARAGLPGGIADIEVTDIVDGRPTPTADDLKAEGADVVVLLVHEGAADDRLRDAWPTTRRPTSARSSTASTRTSTRSSPGTPTWPTTARSRSPGGDRGRAVTDVRCLGRPVRRQPQPAQVHRRHRRPARSWRKTPGASWRCRRSDAGPTCPTTRPTQPTKAIVDAAWPTPRCSGAVASSARSPGRSTGRKLANGTTENRGGESTLGNLVAEVQRWATESREAGCGATSGS